MLKHSTPEQKKYYYDVLYPFQDEILNCLITPKIYLSGGTCLSRFYYHHRYSDDLDFFYDGFNFPKQDFIFTVREIISAINKLCTIEITVEGEHFVRAIAQKNSVNLKIEFIYESFSVIGERKTINNFLIDTKENIATNKITAVYDRKTVKDYADLFFLLKEFTLDELHRWAKLKAVPLGYEEVLLAFADHRLEGSVVMESNLDEKEFHLFVQSLIKDLISYAQRQ